MKRILILGGGTGGLVAANELRKKLSKEHKIILIDRNDKHIYAPSFLWLMLGKRKAQKIQKPLKLVKRKGIDFVNEEIIKILPEKKIVKTTRNEFDYDYLIISLGAELAPENIKGLSNAGYNLYQLEDVERLRDDLKKFKGEKVSIVISSLPFKCPAAPYEAAFLLDEYFDKKGVREKTEISIFTPEALPMPAAGPKNGEIIKSMLESRNIRFNPETQLVSVDSNKKEIQFKDKTPVNYDLLIFVPPHKGPEVIINSNLGNEMGWIPVDKNTLKTNHNNIFAIGDVASITLSSGKPLSKAGVFAHFEAEVVADNIAAEIKRLNADKRYDGRAYCFLELGYGKAGFAGGNFYAEPVPAIKMRRPGRLWHLGKLLFEKYWFWKWF
ncbi:MAG: NAD(P)/FAD-dependent oxidoreductase [Nanoarchaeota archaeon]|nr:NAD(P)/FAD-dependent oxidoreductase [DPANN group archaeon]MBL7116228.1 NAD(P)/FAD-dependent oxidoreductase [Nanoarchaeota archaeon]